MNLVRRDGEWTEEMFGSSGVTALLIIRRYATLVGPKEVDVAQGNIARLGQLDGCSKELERDAPTGKRDALGLAGTIGGGDFTEPRRRHSDRKRVSIRERYQLKAGLYQVSVWYHSELIAVNDAALSRQTKFATGRSF